MAHSQPEHKKHDIFAAGKANDVSNRFFGEDEMRGSESNARVTNTLLIDVWASRFRCRTGSYAESKVRNKCVREYPVDSVFTGGDFMYTKAQPAVGGLSAIRTIGVSQFG